MASHESALKAHRQSLKNRERNRQFRLRGALKTIRAAIDGNERAGAKNGLKQTISLIDKMASKGIIHRNAAGRYKSRLTTRIAARVAAPRGPAEQAEPPASAGGSMLQEFTL